MLKSIIAAILSALLSFWGQRRDAARQRADDHAAGAQAAENNLLKEQAHEARRAHQIRDDAVNAPADRLRSDDGFRRD